MDSSLQDKSVVIQPVESCFIMEKNFTKVCYAMEKKSKKLTRVEKKSKDHHMKKNL